MRCVECTVYSAECGVNSGMWKNATCNVQRVECGVWSVQCGVWGAEFGATIVNSRVRSAECGV